MPRKLLHLTTQGKHSNIDGLQVWPSITSWYLDATELGVGYVRSLSITVNVKLLHPAEAKATTLQLSDLVAAELDLTYRAPIYRY